MYLHFLEFLYFLNLVHSTFFYSLQYETVLTSDLTLFWINYTVMNLFFAVEYWYSALLKILIMHLSIWMWKGAIWDYFLTRRDTILSQYEKTKVETLMDLLGNAYDSYLFLKLSVSKIHAAIEQKVGKRAEGGDRSRTRHKSKDK